MKPEIGPGAGQTIAVRQELDAGRARRAAQTLAGDLGFNLSRKMELTTAVSELAHNLVWHSLAGGTIILKAISNGERSGIEIICQDEGPGIPDVEQAMQDGFSTNGGLGGGLPGAKRLLDEFHLESQAGRGTIIVGRKWA